MFGSGDGSGLGVGAFSKSWRARGATVLIIGGAGTVVGFSTGNPLGGLLLGFVLGVGSVVMGESSMDTGAYKYPEKYF